MLSLENELYRYYSSLERLETNNCNTNIKDLRLFNKLNVLDNNYIDIFKNINSIRYQFFKRDLNDIKYVDYLYDKLGLLNVVSTFRFIHAYNCKTLRLRKRILNILDYEFSYFVTFTFDNRKLRKKDLSFYSNKTLRDYVTKWLKQNTFDYVGNIDFGGKNGRLHFHCVVSSNDKIDLSSWKYGALNIKRIYNNNDKQLALYVNKLCNHALKESTKNQYLIYPKNVR